VRSGDVGAPGSPTRSPTTPRTLALRGLRVIIAGAGLSRRCPAWWPPIRICPSSVSPDQPDLGGRRAGRAAVDFADASGSAGRLRGRRQRPQRGGAGRAHPGRVSREGRSPVIDRYTRPSCARSGPITRASRPCAAWRWPPARRWMADGGRAGGDPRRHVHRRGDQRTGETTDHDVAAFVDVSCRSAGPGGALDPPRPGRSSDVLDTGLALSAAACRRAAGFPDARALVTALAESRASNRHHLCVGRTHGVHAEPTPSDQPGRLCPSKPIGRRGLEARLRASGGGRPSPERWAPTPATSPV